MLRSLLVHGLTAIMLVCAPCAVTAEDDVRAGRVTAVNAWCKSPHIFKETISRFIERGARASVEYLNGAFSVGACTVLPDSAYTLFQAKEVVARYARGIAGPEVVIEGKLLTGETVYVWDDLDNLDGYFGPQT